MHLSNSNGWQKNNLIENSKFCKSDSGGEYRRFTNLMKKEGIIHKFSCPHTFA